MTMNREILTYPPLRHTLPFASPANHGGYPATRALQDVYAAVGYPRTPQGQVTQMAALRGSTAAYYADNELRFRHPSSDIDVIALTEAAGPTGARYLFYTATCPPPVEREVDILCFTSARLEVEHSARYRTFLATKLIQPGVPIIGAGEYERRKLTAMTALIQRGAIRRQQPRITPSGAAQLVLEEDLFAEPWRWLSMRTYFIEAPTAARQRFLLTHFCHHALRNLAAHGAARDVTAMHALSPEPVFEIDLTGMRYGPLIADRMRTIYSFAYDQFSILFHSGGKSFTLEKAARFLMKALSLARNPRLRFDADLIFDALHSR